MSTWDKLLKRLYVLDKNLAYEELAKILNTYGYEAKETKGGSSHITFRKKNCLPVTIPRHGKINIAYIKLVREAVEKENTI